MWKRLRQRLWPEWKVLAPQSVRNRVRKGPVNLPSDLDDDTHTFDDHFNRLVRSMNELETLLGDVGEDFWRDWIRKDLTRIENGDRYALAHFLGAFGGMGSFSDLVISPMNGHEISEEHIGSSNDRLGVLRSRAWASAKAMQRELDRH
jgi:Domain of unknown function (DUF6966)